MFLRSLATIFIRWDRASKYLIAVKSSIREPFDDAWNNNGFLNSYFATFQVGKIGKVRRIMDYYF